MALRVDGARRSLPVAATVVTMVIAIPTAMVQAAIVAVVTMSIVARGDIHHRPAHGRPRPIHDCGWTRRRIGRTRGCGHHDGRGETDWSSEGNIQRPTACAEAVHPRTATTATKPKRGFVFMNGSTGHSQGSSAEWKSGKLFEMKQLE